jgi:hypothetical protein
VSQCRKQEKARLLLEEIPPEQNKITRYWHEIGERPTNAAHSQALVHLRKHWCDAQKCLECEIGCYSLGGYQPVTVTSTDLV